MRGPCPSVRALLVGAFWLVVIAAGRAGVETRAFTILVDGKSAGACRLTFDDNSGTTSGRAAVQVHHVLGTYRYHFDGAEVWKDGRLQQLHSDTNDNGKKCTIEATAGPTGLRVVANGRTSVMRTQAWPTTYWRLPSADLRDQPLTLLDTDTGNALAARLQVVGPARLIVSGQTIDCTHYRVTGQAEADLWYDTQDRLVRQETLEDGHRTILVLKELRRP